MQTGFISLNSEDNYIELKYLEILGNVEKGRSKRTLRDQRVQNWAIDLDIFNFSPKKKEYLSLKHLQVVPEKNFCSGTTTCTQIKGGFRGWKNRLRYNLNVASICYEKLFAEYNPITSHLRNSGKKKKKLAISLKWNEWNIFWMKYLFPLGTQELLSDWKTGTLNSNNLVSDIP